MGPVMSVDESQSLILKEFALKMNLRDTEGPCSKMIPVQHDFVDILAWKWKMYPVLGAYDNYGDFRANTRAEVRRNRLRE